MKTARLAWIVAIGLAFSRPAVAVEGTSFEKPVAQKPFQYVPQDPVFWFEVTSGDQDRNYLYLVQIGNQKARRSKPDSAEQAEGRLALGIGLARLGLSFAASEIFRDLARGRPDTPIAFVALAELEQILRKDPSDFETLAGELILDQDIGAWPAPLSDFAAFVNAEFNRSHGFDAWAEADLKKISPDSYWGLRSKYLLGVQDVAAGNIDAAIEKFSTLAQGASVPEELRDSASHQWARLIFEKGDFEKAYKIFRSVKLNPRERGALLLERAWSLYYEKNYGRALGLLAALQAPVFEASRTGEASVLEALIYKELCYPDVTRQVVEDFNKRFAKSLQAIRGRRDLRSDPLLVRLSVLDARVRIFADLLNQLRWERGRWAELKLDSFAALNGFQRRYDLKMNEMTDRLNWVLIKKTRETAEQVLDWSDQMSFIDYQTRIDALRIKSGAVESYKLEDVPHMTFDKIYWIFQGEYWIDEIEQLKVNVESRCAAGGDAA